MKRSVCAASSALALLWAAPAAAQNSAGVFGPAVNDGTKLIEYRLGYRPQDGTDGVNHRLHYDWAANDDLMWRFVSQIGGSADDQSLDYVKAELYWDLSEDGQPWRTGLRFDGQIGGGDAPDQVAINWTNQFVLSERWTARAVLLNKVQLGDNAANGVAFETRATAFTQTENGITWGFDTYNNHGSTEDLDVFGGTQQAGAFAVFPVAEGWGLRPSVLLGLNDRSPDADFRLWLSKSL